MTLIPIVRYFSPTLIVNVVGTVVTFRDGNGLNMKFTVRRSIATTPDSCMVEIEGLDPIRARLMNTVFSELGVGAKMIVQGGYETGVGGLFTGDLRDFRTEIRRGPESWTQATADDGGDAISDTIVPVPSTAGLTAQNMADLASAAMGLVQSPSVAATIAASNPLAQGPYSATGVRTARDLLDAVARRCKCRWWVRDSQLFLGARGIADPSRPAILLTDATIVQPVSESGSGSVRVGCFFDPNIVPGGQVAYRATRIRVESVVHSGETRGGQVWTSQIVGRTL